MQHGIGLSTLSRWLREPEAQAVDAPPPVRWQEVPLASVLGTSPWAAELVFADGTTLRLASAAVSSVLPPWLASRP